MENKYIFLLFFTFSQFNYSFGQEKDLAYKSEAVEVVKIASSTFIHISYLNTEDFGKVECNGMIVIHKGESLLFDTQANDEASLELIKKSVLS